MNPQTKRLWVTALRSNDYKQGQYTLNRNGKYCCLGVLCDLYLKETGKGEWKDSGVEGVKSFTVDNVGSNVGLVDQVREWAGDIEAGVEHKLIWLNDMGKTFEEIAIQIESTSI